LDQNRQGGFTLIEVMVSSLILVIVVVSLLSLFVQSIQIAHGVRSYSLAILHAQRLVDEFILGVGGRLPLPLTVINDTFSFQRGVRTHPSTGLVEVVVTVFWVNRGVQRNFRVVGLVAQ